MSEDLEYQLHLADWLDDESGELDLELQDLTAGFIPYNDACDMEIE